MEKIFPILVFVLLNAGGNQCEEGLEARLGSLTVELDEKLPTGECNQTLENLKHLLTSTSRNIFNLTKGRSQVKDVVVRLPLSWHSCAPSTAVVTDSKTEAEVKVTSAHPLLGDMPWTLQYAGCHQPGKNIELPIGFLAKNKSIEEKGSLLAREWVKLQFGVFEENGFDNDNLYPTTFAEGKTNMTNSGCDVDDDQLFCPTSATYNEDLPTKQNILCHRASINQILEKALEPLATSTTTLSPNVDISTKIRDPTSFTVGTGPQAVFQPLTFHYQLPARKRFVVILERSSAMGLNNRWSLLHAELFRFITSLPNDVELALVTFGKTASVILKPTLLTAENREGVYGRIPRRHLDDDTACLDCAINLATNTLGGHNNMGSLLLITATSTEPVGYAELVHNVNAGGSQVHTIAFEKSVFYKARQLGRYGKTFIVHENSHDVMASAVNISDIFTSILSNAGGVRLQKFHQEQKISDDSNLVSGNFVVEESLRKNLWVQISSPDQDDIEYFELTNPTGKVFQFPKFEHGLVYFRLAGLQEPGIWSYQARLFRKVKFARAAVQALAEPSHEDWAQLEAWTSVNHEGVNALKTPVMIFARVVRNNSPILDAEVVATVLRPGGAAPVMVTLRDTGSGYPDITRGDGIYSAYFTQFISEPGFYSVVVSAANKNGEARLPRLSEAEADSELACCGSSMPFSFTVPTTPFSRHALTGSFFVKEGSQFYLRQGSPHRNDVYPPSRITDFQLANYLDNSLYVTLKWTAPGNDYDFGQAFRYEIRCYTNREALREENFTDMGILVHTSLIPVPEPYAEEQRSTVGIPWPNEVFYYAIVAYDEEGNRGQVSNVISVYAEEKPSTQQPLIGFDSAILDNESYPHHESLPLTARSSDRLIYIISGVISAVLLLVLVVVVATLLRARWARQIKRSSSSQIYVRDYDSSLGGTLRKAQNSLPDVTKENTINDAKWRDDTDSCGKDSTINKSPIPSISDNLSWRYLGPQRAAGQEAAPVHRVEHASPSSPHPASSSTDSSLYSDSSDTTASAEFVLGQSTSALPRISVMEDYTVYRDLSHIGHHGPPEDYFSFSQLPAELQGLALVPYSPGFDTMESQKSRRHISLV